MSPTIQIDDTSLLLLTSLIILSLLPRLFSTNAQAHPLLFAKQSETSTVRRAGKSAVYRHWSTGSGGRLAARPEVGVDGVREMVEVGQRKGKRWIGETVVDLPRCLKELEKGLEVLLSKTNKGKDVGGETNQIITCVPTTPATLLPLVLLHLLPSCSTSTTTTTDTNSEDINSENKKKKQSSSSSQKYQLVTLDGPQVLPHALAEFENANVLVASLEEVNLILGLVPSSSLKTEKKHLIVLPTTTTTVAIDTNEPSPFPADLVHLASDKGYKLITFNDVLGTGRREKVDATLEQEKDTAGVVQEMEKKSDPDAVHSFVLLPRTLNTTTTSISSKTQHNDDGESEQPQILTITNANITSGVTAILSLFPATHRPSSASSSASAGGKKDVFLSSVDFAQPFGLAVAMSALYVGADLVFVPPSKSIQDLSLPEGAPQPTVAFLSPVQLRTLTSTIAEKAKTNLLYPLAKRQAQARLRDGSVDRSGWAERVVWRPTRAGTGVVGGLRCVVVTGEKTDDTLSVDEVEEAFIHLGIPVMRTYSHPRATAPVTATHFFDYQLVPYLGIESEDVAGGKMHSGPPGANIEIELRGAEVDRGMEKGGDPRGAMYVRGPTVLRPLLASAGSTSTKSDDDEWVGLGVTALARTSGTFVVL